MKNHFYINLALFVLGLFLLIITCLGQWTKLGLYPTTPLASYEIYDPALAERTPNLESLYQEALKTPLFNTFSPQQKMIALYNLSARRFTQGTIQFNLFSNWLLWSGGFFHHSLLPIWNPDDLLKYGRSALCGQVSFILLHLALKAGMRARHVGLNGHVVMEAWYDNAWHMFDPYLEIIPMTSEGKILNVTKLAQNPTFLETLLKPKNETPETHQNMIKIFTSIENYTFISYPSGALFVWKADVILFITKVAQKLKWIIPILMIFWSLISYFRSSKIPSSSAGAGKLMSTARFLP